MYKKKHNFVISKTPFRLSFLGGGTDFSHYYSKYGCTVISTTIDKYCYIQIKKLYPFFDYNYRIVYSNIELKSKIEKILHPSVKSCLKYFREKNNLEIFHQGDLPSMTGVGSSSSFVVGLLNALSCYYGKKKLSNDQLSNLAIDIERNKNKENGGIQDQYAVSYGGMNIYNFNKNKNYIYKVRNQNIKKKIKKSLIIVGTKAKRISSGIIDSYNKDLSILHGIKDLADEGKKIINNNFKIKTFAELVKQSWELKKKLSEKVSNNEIDSVLKFGFKNGAFGGKLIGAGGAGCLIFFVEDKRYFRKNFFDHKFKNLFEIPFNFDENGSQIIYKK